MVAGALMQIFVSPPRALAVDSAQEAYALAEEDCKKIAMQLGKETPINLYIGGTGLDTYSVSCGFSNEGFPGFAFLQVEDMRIAINSIGFSRSTPEAAQNFRAKRNASEDTKETTKDGFEKIHRKTPDGSEYIYKGYLLFTRQEFRKTHTAEVSIVRGTCTVSVTGRSAYGGASYHISDPKTHEDINKHPGFNHDREAEILALARQKAEEVFSVLDCGGGIPSTALPVETPPAVIDWQKCFAECPAVTGSKECTITSDTRPSDTQCLKDLLSASHSCQNTCIAIMPPRECSSSATSPAVPFPEIKLGDRTYFAGGTEDIDLSIPPDTEHDYIFDGEENNKYIRKLLEDAGAREIDLTQLVIDSDLPEVRDTNNSVFTDSTNSDTQPTAEATDNPATTNVSKPKNISLGEGAKVFSLEGDVDVLIPGETEWRTLKQGDIIPAGSRVFTGMDSDLLINFPKYGVAKVRSFSDFILDQNTVDESCREGSRTPLLYHLDLRSGEAEFRVEPQWNYQGSMQVTTPSATNAVRGTHFWVSYDSVKNISVTGVYKGTVAVTDLATGKTMNLQPRLDGTSGIAIIGSVGIMQRDSGVAKESNRSGGRLMEIFITLFVLGGGVFILHKTGKLQPILQKVLRLVRKKNSIQP